MTLNRPFMYTCVYAYGKLIESDFIVSILVFLEKYYNFVVIIYL